ncbi:P6 [Firespike leaf roll-associated virus]|nr:P6 [Firespike leaf roll-associated virus]
MKGMVDVFDVHIVWFTDALLLIILSITVVGIFQCCKRLRLLNGGDRGEPEGNRPRF